MQENYEPCTITGKQNEMQAGYTDSRTTAIPKTKSVNDLAIT